MEENIKITKLPDILNPNKIAEKKIFEKYGICPFCGEKERFGCDNSRGSKGVWDWETTWYGKHDKNNNKFSWLRFWEKNIIWKCKKFECHTCGAKWESPPYPKNIGGYK